MTTTNSRGEPLSAEYRECQVCRSTLNKPKILRCLHVFCADCIMSKSRAASVGYAISCPICGVDITYTKESLPSANFLKTLQTVMSLRDSQTDYRACEFCSEPDVSPAIFLCLECQVNACGPCLAIHDKVKGTENHRSYKFIDSNLQDICRKRNDTHCDRHPDEIVTFHCDTCSRLICVVCELTEHPTHERRPLADLAMEARDELYSLATVLKSFQKLAQSDLQDSSRSATHEDATRDVEETIHKTAQGLHSMIDVLASDLKEQAKRQAANNVEKMSVSRKEIQKRLEGTKSSAVFPEHLSNYGSDVDVVNIIPLVRDTVKNIQKSQQFIPEQSFVHYTPKVMVTENKIVSIGELTIDGRLINHKPQESSPHNYAETVTQEKSDMSEQRPETVILRKSDDEFAKRNSSKPSRTDDKSPGDKGSPEATSKLLKEPSLPSATKVKSPRIPVTRDLKTKLPSLKNRVPSTTNSQLHTSSSGKSAIKIPVYHHSRIDKTVNVIRTFDTHWDITKVVVDAKNNYLVASRLHKIPSLYTSSGTLIRNLENCNENPYSFAILRNGNYIISDADSGRVSIANVFGATVTTLPENSIDKPTGVCLDRRENIVVCDVGKKDAIIFVNQSHFSVLKSCTAENGRELFNSPMDVACSKQGHLAVVDTGDHCVRIFDENLLLKASYGTYGDGEIQLKSPRGACIDDQNRLIIADYYNDRLVMVSILGEFLKILIGREQGILGPRSVTIDSEGNIVLAQENGKIKVIEY